MKMLIEEKELSTRKGLYIGLPIGWCVTSDNYVKILGPIVEPFAPVGSYTPQNQTNHRHEVSKIKQDSKKRTTKDANEINNMLDGK